MRAHYLQHVPFEGLASIEPWLQQAGYDISSTRLFSFEALPDIEDIDFLIVMGGTMSVNDEAQYPWLPAEKRFIHSAIEAEKSVLGICLGAQLIASALGSKVFPNGEKEIGWFPVQALANDSAAIFQFPDQTSVFHWHGDTFDLPPGAIQLARSKVCENQAFQLGTKVIGLQFHLETTAASAQAILENCRSELIESDYIQSELEIMSAPEQRYESINRLMASVLDYLHPNNG